MLRRRKQSSVLIPAVALCWLLVATPAASTQAETIPNLPPAERIKLDEFEPAVRDQVSRIYEQARKKTSDAGAAGKLGMMFHVYGRYELAEACYLRAHALAPRAFRWSYYLAIVEKALGKNDQAIIHLRDALRIDRGYAPASIQLAQLLMDSGDVEQSDEIYRSVIARNKNLATAHFGLGQVFAARADWPAAIESYLRACKIAPNYAAAHYALGMAYRNTGDMTRAKEHLQHYQETKDLKAISEDALMDEVHALYSGGLTRFAKGSQLYVQGSPGEAIAEFEAALAVNPRLVMAHINLIALYGQLNQAEKAEQHFRSAVELDPGWVETYYNWGFFLAQHGRKPEAAELFRKAIEINPNYSEAHVQLGLILDDSGKPGEAADHYRRALEVNPNNRQAHYFLGRNLLRGGRAKEAIPHLLETTKVEDAWTPACMQAVAIAYEQDGNRQRAVQFLREAKKRAVALQLRDMVSQLERELDRLSSEAHSH